MDTISRTADFFLLKTNSTKPNPGNPGAQTIVSSILYHQKKIIFSSKTKLCSATLFFGADSICNTECFPPSCIAPPRLFTEKCIDFHLALEQKLEQNVNLPLFISFCFQISQGQKNPKSKLKNLLFYSVKGQLCINMSLMQTNPNASISHIFPHFKLQARSDATS